jgi:RHS repeat-associated protein
VRLTSFYYDNHVNLTDAPTKGSLTKRVRWNGTSNPTPTDLYSYDTVGNLLTTTDPLNNITTITYDSLKVFPLTTSNALSHVVTTEYYGINGVSLNSGGYVGLWGQVKSVQDANNQKAYRVYDTFGRMIKSISPLDSVSFPTTIVEYTFTSQYSKVLTRQRRNPGVAGVIDTAAFYDGLGRHIQTKTETISATQFIIGGQTQYNSRGLPQYKYVPRFTSNNLTVMDPINTTQPRVKIDYDAMGRVLKTTNPNGTYSNTVYKGWRTEQYDERGARNDYTYDAYGRVKKVEEYGGYDGRSSVYPAIIYYWNSSTNYTYDSEGNLKTVVDTASNTTSINYDNLGRKTSMTDPDMGTWSYTYDLNGNLKTQTDAKGQVITFTYDALNRLKTKTSGTTLNVTYTYDDTVNSGFAKGRLSKVDYTGGSTRFVYDLLGREIQSVKTIDGQNYTVSRVYDNLNNVTKITYPDLSTVFYQYNSVGQLQAVSNDLAVMPPLVFNQTPNVQPQTMLARLKGIFSTPSLRAERSEAKQSKIATNKIASACGLAMTSVKETSNGMKEKVSKFYTAWVEPYVFGIATAEAAAPPTLFVKQITYNAMGQATRLEYGNGTVTTQTYDTTMFRLKRINTVNAQNVVLQDLNYTYDAIGNVRTIADAKNTATQTFSYDHRNRLLTAAEPSGYGSLSYSYASAIGNIGTKEGITYTYSKVNAGPHAVTSLSDGTAISYDVNGNMTAMIKTGDSKAFSYDVENRLIDVIKNSATLAQYFYDGDGGRVRKVNYSTAQAGNNTCFLAGTKILLADGTSKLIEEIKVGDMVASYDEKKMVKTSAKATAMFDSESAKEYLLINGSLKVTPNHMFYSQGEWKAIGKMAVGDLLLDENLNEVTIDKIEKIKSQNPIQVYNLEVEGEHNYFANGILVHNKLSYGSLSGGVNVTSGVVTNYVGSLYEETSAVGVNSVFLGSAKIATVSNNQVRFYFQDHLGSTNVVTDSAGASIELIEYKPFGEFARHEKYGGNANTAWYYFTGKPLDDETGLMFYGARYYSPLLGRFITPDTIVQAPMNPQTLNRYSYCGNNPVNHIDPSGHFWFVPFIIAAVKGAVIGATLGAATAAITGGNIGQGALFGAIGGAVFAGMGSIVQNAVRYATIPGGIGPMTAGASFSADMLGSIVGGAAAGAAGAGYLGADPLQGAGIGALSGGLFGGISRMPGTGWGGVGRIGLAGIAGGGISEVAGGSFIDGFIFAGSIASADFVYRAILVSKGYRLGATMETAKSSGEAKLKLDEKGEAKLIKTLNIDKPNTNNMGVPALPNESGGMFSVHFWASETGPVMNNMSKYLPGGNGLSHVHDITGNFLSTKLGNSINGVFLNFQTMPIAYGLNAVGAAINDVPGLIGLYEKYVGQ